MLRLLKVALVAVALGILAGIPFLSDVSHSVPLVIAGPVVLDPGPILNGGGHLSRP